MKRVTFDLYRHNGDTEVEVELEEQDEDSDYLITVGRQQAYCSIDSVRQFAIALLRLTDGSL